MRIVVLDGYTLDMGQPSQWAELEMLGEVVVYPRTPAEQTIVRCRGAALVMTNKVVLDAGVLAGLPELRYIGLCSTGTNAVALDVARDRGIAVSNVPGYSTESVAELVFAMVLHFAFDVAGHSAAVKRRQWAAGPDFCFQLRPSMEIAGKTMVVVGMGAIGGAVARMAGAFGMRVVAAAVPGSPRSTDRVPLERALPEADVVTLHCPLTSGTAGMVNSDFLARLKAGAIVINTSRGGVVNESDMVTALAAGHLGGFASDVLAQEPPSPHHPLTDPAAPWADRVVITPHLAWLTVEARARLRHEIAENLAAFLRGERRNRIV